MLCYFGGGAAASCLLSVILVFIFNVFSKSKVGIDRWSVADILMSVVNTSVFLVFIFYINSDNFFLKDDEDNIKGISALVVYMQLAMVVVSWLRFISLFLVVSAVSKLLITIIKIIMECFIFLFIVICYFLMMLPVIFVIFNESDPALFDPIRCMFVLWDGLMNAWAETAVDPWVNQYSTIWICFIICHNFFANLIMLNYLIAIASTIYENMVEVGDFVYKANKYMYIERYLKAM